ncbi:MAG: tetratricopeptide repeat protein [Planctomycetes bacterium]|nr:tetratricopeptide repeat protein [Planctomycetota bacterium]
MERTQKDDLLVFLDKEAWTAEDCKAIFSSLFSCPDAVRVFKELVSRLEEQNPQAKGQAALKVGIARYMLCRFDSALEALAAATDNKDRHYFQALCLKSMRQYEKAAEEFSRAKDRGWDSHEIAFNLIELQALGGDIGGAAKAVEKHAAKAETSADWQYLVGLVCELTGEGEKAAEAYHKARAIDQNHAAASFRLAFYYDLHGDEEQAMSLYKQCISSPPVHSSALMNMAVLYEDAGKYENAMGCLRRVLAVNPGHLRARLFVKDVEASLDMYYDEDQAKRIAKRNAVLDIPVTDFELSVRARNCLRKMNIGTLGDLVRTTEADLLSYKNFGETSLKEIKDMLTAKNLRLGQAMEEDGSFETPAAGEPPVAPPPAADQGLLATPIDQVQFSIRCRRVLETLKVATLGDLAAKSEAELMTCKNFGQTSLNEIRQRLGENGLKLRESD